MVHVRFGSRPPSWSQNQVKVLVDAESSLYSMRHHRAPAADGLLPNGWHSAGRQLDVVRVVAATAAIRAIRRPCHQIETVSGGRGGTWAGSVQHSPLALNCHPGSADSVNPSTGLRRSATVTSTLLPLGPGTSDKTRVKSQPRATPDQCVLGFFWEADGVAAAGAAGAGLASASTGASAWPCYKELWRSLCAAALLAPAAPHCLH